MGRASQGPAGPIPDHRARKRFLVALAVIVPLLGSGLFLAVRDDAREAVDRERSPPTHVGAEVCAGCHAAEAERWSGSDHALAMQAADDRTVLGDFRDASFTQFGITSTFFRREGKHFVRTEGPDGQLAEYPIAYTFGVHPLQQYLIPFPGGRFQSLTIAWDSRPAADGGQRWFSLYPDERIAPGDPLHWTGREQNWNYMCADCHSTNLRRGYDLAKDSYVTTWSDVNVACEACHGPGSAHVAWAKARPASGEDDGLAVRLKGPAGGGWTFDDPKTGIARWSGPRRTGAELDACAPCHSRRRIIATDPQPGAVLLDTYVPNLLEPGLYHADGQILGEVYEYGSFVQSKMHQAGVTCSDCHDPHSLKLRAEGNAVCARCHLPAKFDTPSHHHHVPGSEASLCVSCHMPSKRYMAIDPRRDHAFRVPRPDHTVALGTPNACAGCHGDKPTLWAVEAVTRWYGPRRAPERRYPAAIDAARRGMPESEKLLAAVVIDPAEPAIARATALALLEEFLSPASAPTLQIAARDQEPLVRAAAARALPPEARVPVGGPLLLDPVRSVRIEAARSLAAVDRETIAPDFRAALAREIEDLVRSELTAADRPESHLNLSLVHAAMHRLDAAESELRTALRLDPRFVPALVNLADLQRELGRDDEGERILLQALEVLPTSAETLHALGLLRARQGKSRDAIDLLRRAAELRPENVRMSYVHAIALQSSGDLPGAIGVLESTHRRRPADRDILTALATISRDRGDRESAVRWAEQLLELSPGNQDVRAFLEELRRQ